MAWLGTAALSGFVGGRSDAISCNALERLTALIKQPDNHDIVKGLVRSLFESLTDFFSAAERLNPFPGLDARLAELSDVAADNPDSVMDLSPPLERLVVALSTGLSEFLARTDGEASRQGIEDSLSAAVVDWLATETNEPVPPLLAELIQHGGKLNGHDLQSWSDYFRIRVGELIKQRHSRFREILSIQFAASNNQLAKESLKGLQETRLSLERLTAASQAPAWDQLVAASTQQCELLTRSTGTRIALPVARPLPGVQLGQQFQLRFEVSQRSNGFLVQRFASQWYPTPIKSTVALSTGTLFTADVYQGQARFPTDTYLVENNPNHVGPRLFVIVCTSEPFPETVIEALHHHEILNNVDLNQIAEFIANLPETSRQVFTCECEFVIPTTHEGRQ